MVERSRELTLLLHLHGMCPGHCKICPWHLPSPQKYIDPETISRFFETLRGRGYSFNDAFMLCPNPFNHPSLDRVYRIVRDNCKNINILIPVNEILSLRLGVLSKYDRLLLLVDSFPKLYSRRHSILALESHGFDRIELIFPIIPKVNELEIREVLEFCRVRGLRLGFIQGASEGLSLPSLISKMKDVYIGEEHGFFVGCLSERTAFYKDFPFQIITSSYRESCNTIYLNNLRMVGRCPLSRDYHRVEEFEVLDLNDLECPNNPRELSFTPKVKLSLISPTGVEIDEMELRILDMVARSQSLRHIAENLKVSHTSIRKRIMNLQEKLSAKLIERDPHTGKIGLTKMGWKIVDEYRRLKRRYKGLTL